MPALYVLILVGVVLFWVLAAGSYKHLGRIFRRLFQDVIDAVNYEEEK